MSTLWKGYFINFSIELYFGICSVMYTGENPQGRGSSNAMRKESGDEDDNNKEELGECFRPHTKNFKGLEQNKDPWSIGK
jgi:hypothetical protein